jgi:peptidylprolyl isomerase
MKIAFSLLLSLTVCFAHCFTSLQAEEGATGAQPAAKEEATTAPQRPVVEVETNYGTFELTLWPDVAPKATENFLTHAKDGYYNGVIFHRIIRGFMMQGGDPRGTGEGGESIYGVCFEDECSENVKFDRPYLLAMANAGPKTNSSQFFITFAPTTWLNMKHSIFGEVTKGQDVINKIEAVETAPGDRPKEDVKMIKLTVKNPPVEKK